MLPTVISRPAVTADTFELGADFSGISHYPGPSAQSNISLNIQLIPELMDYPDKNREESPEPRLRVQTFRSNVMIAEPNILNVVSQGKSALFYHSLNLSNNALSNRVLGSGLLINSHKQQDLLSLMQTRSGDHAILNQTLGEGRQLLVSGHAINQLQSFQNINPVQDARGNIWILSGSFIKKFNLEQTQSLWMFNLSDSIEELGILTPFESLKFVYQPIVLESEDPKMDRVVVTVYDPLTRRIHFLKMGLLDECEFSPVNCNPRILEHKFQDVSSHDDMGLIPLRVFKTRLPSETQLIYVLQNKLSQSGEPLDILILTINSENEFGSIQIKENIAQNSEIIAVKDQTLLLLKRQRVLNSPSSNCSEINDQLILLIMFQMNAKSIKIHI